MLERSRTKKRRFQGNQHVLSKGAKLSKNSLQSPSTLLTRVQENQDEGSNESSKSAFARRISDTVQHTVNENEASGYCFIDISIPCSIFQMLP